MKLAHAVLTRFSFRSYRNVSAAGASPNPKTIDPLDPRRLRYRFAFFESVCAPSVITQSEQGFDWILIVDRDLPRDYRARLDALVGDRPRTHLHDFSSHEELCRLGWLPAVGDSSHVLTTLLDDDDALPVDFVECIQRHVGSLEPELPPVKILGVKQSLEWDLVPTLRRPLGSFSPWSRPCWPRSAGFSLLCKYPAHDCSVLNLNHLAGELYFDPRSGERLRQRFRELTGADFEAGTLEAIRAPFRDLIARSLAADGVAIERLPPGVCFHDLSSELGGPVVQTNHFLNDQETRIFEPQRDRRPVTGPGSFPGVRIDWERLDRNRRLLRKSRYLYEQLAREQTAALDREEAGWKSRAAAHIGLLVRYLLH